MEEDVGSQKNGAMIQADKIPDRIRCARHE